MPAARPRFPNHADLLASPVARPDGSLAAVRALGDLDGDAWGGQRQSPPHWAPAGAMWAPDCSPCLCCWAGASKQRLHRGTSLPLELGGQAPPYPEPSLS